MRWYYWFGGVDEDFQVDDEPTVCLIFSFFCFLLLKKNAELNLVLMNNIWPVFEDIVKWILKFECIILFTCDVSAGGHAETNN